jgi:pyruvate-ferredoxin/flavodoxin oxidoreductase
MPTNGRPTGEKPIWRDSESGCDANEGGAAGAVHGSLQAGALSTTFTHRRALLMIPNMYKIAENCLPAVSCVRTALAAQALSIFGDHSDEWPAVRPVLLFWHRRCSGSYDMAAVAHLSTINRVFPSFIF